MNKKIIEKDDSRSNSAWALYFDGKRGVSLESEPVPYPKEGEVTIKAICQLISPGTEMNVYRGTVSSGAEIGYPQYNTPPYPLKYGYQTVGEITEAGPNSDFKVGDRVFAIHPHQSSFTLQTQVGSWPMVCRVPDFLTDDQAAFASLASVALNGLLDAPPRLGDVVAVSGLGIIGSLVAQLLRPIVGGLILIDPLASRRELAQSIGADAVVSPDDARDAIAALTEGRGVDIYYETSGAPASLQAGLGHSAQDATIVVLSYFGDRVVPLALSPDFLLRRQRIVSSMVGGLAPEISGRWTMARRMQVAMSRLANIDVSRLVSHRIAFRDAAAAYVLIDERPTEALGILLEHR